MLIWLLVPVVTAIVLASVLRKLREASTMGVARVGLGAVFVVAGPIIYSIAGYWFTISLDIDASPSRLRHFEAGPWAIGCGLAVVVGLGLCGSGAIARRGERAAA